MSTAKYLATVQQVKDLTAITDNVDSKHIVPGMQTAHDLKMEGILGPILIKSLLDQLSTEIVILSATNALPVAVTTDGLHKFSTGDSVYIQGATGAEVNGQYTITVTSATEFELDGLDGTALSTYDLGSATVMRMPAVNVAIMELVRKTFAWWAFADCVPFMVGHIVNAGIMQQNGSARGLGNDGGVQVSQAEMKRYVTQAEVKAQAYQQQLVTYMLKHKTDYPEWRPSCTIIDDRTWNELGLDRHGNSLASGNDGVIAGPKKSSRWRISGA